MVISQVVGVGIFLTPATMIRTLGTASSALAVWLVMGTLSAAGALCYAELSTRFPHAGGGYVFLRQAFGRRSAFVYGWMSLIVIDPGLTAALGIGFAQYALAMTDGPQRLVPAVAILAIVAFGLLTMSGMRVSTRVMWWTAVAKLAIVAVLCASALVVAGRDSSRATSGLVAPPPALPALASSVIAAFFAFGGWWELGRMAGEVDDRPRTMPRALVGGIALVTIIYVGATLAFLSVSSPTADTDAAFVSLVGAVLFGRSAGRLLAAMVVIAIAGSLAATLLSAPRMYLAMARDGLFPSGLARFDPERGTLLALTLIQVGLACALVLLGSFEQILGYFIPGAVFFLGLSASAVLTLPRPPENPSTFRVPLYPLPIVLFLGLMVIVLTLFTIGAPRQTAIGAGILLLGIPVSFAVVPRTKGLG